MKCFILAHVCIRNDVSFRTGSNAPTKQRMVAASTLDAVKQKINAGMFVNKPREQSKNSWFRFTLCSS